jgi:hypothetical protein
LRLINKNFASDFKLPKETLLAKVILIYKKGGPSLLGNYRPNALLTSTYQLFRLAVLFATARKEREKHRCTEALTRRLRGAYTLAITAVCR